MLTAIRNPVSRCLSAAYYLGLRPKLAPTDNAGSGSLNSSTFDKILSTYIHSKECSNFHYNYIKSNDGDSIEKVLRSYNLILITERMNESLLVLMLMWNISMAEMIYISSKDMSRSALYQQYNLSDKLEEQSAGIRSIMEGTEFGTRNKKDFEIYEAANAHLDSLIEQIHNFDALLDLFSNALKAAESACLVAEVFNDENDGGIVLDCVWRDGGCYQKCIKDLVEQQKGVFADIQNALDIHSVQGLMKIHDHSKSVC